MIAVPLDSHFCITFTDAKDNNPGFNSFYVSDFRTSVRPTDIHKFKIENFNHVLNFMLIRNKHKYYAIKSNLLRRTYGKT